MRRKVETIYTAVDAGFGTVSKRVEAQFSRVSRSILSTNTLFKAAGGTFVARQAFGAIAEAVGGLTDAYAEQEEAATSLRTALEATGRGGAESFQLITAEASRLQSITTLGDEAIIKASASLATLVPSLDVEGLKDAQTVVVGLADAFFDGNLDTAALQLAKTLGSSTNALARYGIEIENSAAPATEKLSNLISDPKLQTAFSVAQAKAEAFGGDLAQLDNATGDLRESFGGIIGLTLQMGDGIDGLTGRIASLASSIDANQNQWVAWGRVVLQGVLLVGQGVISLTRVAFNLGQGIGSIILALYEVASGNWREARNAIGGLQSAFEDGKDAVFDFGDRLVALGNAAVDASSGIDVIGDKAGSGLGVLSALFGGLEDGADRAGRKTLTVADALNTVEQRASVFGSSVDVVAEKTKVLERAINDLLTKGFLASSTEVTQLVEQLGNVRSEYLLSEEGSAAYAKSLEAVTGAAATAVVGLNEVSVQSENVTVSIREAASDLERAAFAFSDDFADLILDAANRGKVAFSDFADFAINELGRILLRFGALRLATAIFGGPALGFGDFVRGSLGIGNAPVGLGPSPVTATPQLAGASSVTINVHVPKAASPVELARDPVWIRTMEATNQALAEAGLGRINVRVGG